MIEEISLDTILQPVSKLERQEKVKIWNYCENNKKIIEELYLKKYFGISIVDEKEIEGNDKIVIASVAYNHHMFEKDAFNYANKKLSTIILGFFYHLLCRNQKNEKIKYEDFISYAKNNNKVIIMPQRKVKELFSKELQYVCRGVIDIYSVNYSGVTILGIDDKDFSKILFVNRDNMKIALDKITIDENQISEFTFLTNFGEVEEIEL